MIRLLLAPTVVAAIALLSIAGLANARTETGTPHWEIAGELAQPRAYGRAVALATGELLVVGGLDASDPDVTIETSELFDTATRRTTVLAYPLLGRVNQTVTVSTYGDRVIVAGGTEWVEDHWEPVSNVDVYLPWSRTWLPGAPLATSRSDHVAVALRDGRVLVTGGNRGTKLEASTEIYDPATNEWRRAAPLPRARTQASASVLLDGRVLVMGGFESDGALTKRTYLYEPEADRWTDGPLLNDARLNHATVRLPSGDVLLVGGEAKGAGTAELYSFRARSFERAGSLVEPRLVATAASLGDGTVLLAGGLPPQVDAFTPVRIVERWNGSRWVTAPAAPSPRAFGQLVGTRDAVYWVSGSGDGERAARTIERFGR